MRNNLRAMRGYNNLTLDEACKLAGITRCTLINWEQGKTLPKIDKALTLSRIYNCSVYDLYKEESNEEK